MKILIANRGEIARRVNRTAKRLGHRTVAVFAEPDAAAPHVAEADEAVNIGPAALAESYLSAEAVLAAAAQTEADAVHPGYGFLSENAGFAEAVQNAGLIWIGPKPHAIERMGSKIEARRLAAEADVPIIPGFDRSQDHDELRAAAESIGYPVLIKASAGGGGKGIRIADGPTDFDAALSEASTEAERTFGDGTVIVERYIQRPRHIEVQVVGDRHGRVVELGTRECSVQRRYQKVLEEAPAPNLADATRAGLRTSAVDLANAIGYDSAGTVEFIVDDTTGEHFFLEMNTRLQVEHPVTEFITGIDLVEVMIRVAAGEPLPVPEQVRFHGHAIEARINAEDPENDFAPQAGTIRQLRVPDGVRWDSAIEAGGEITPFYDPMIAKLIVGASDRDAAIATMSRALDELVVGGITTNTGLQRWLMDAPDFVAATVTTRFLDGGAYAPGSDLERARSLAATAWSRAHRSAALVSDRASANPWTALASFSATPARPRRQLGLRPVGLGTAEVHELQFLDATDDHGHDTTSDAEPPGAVAVDLEARLVSVNVDGRTYTFDLPTRTERWAATAAGRTASGDAVVAPFPAVVAEIHIDAGDRVEGDQVLLTIEAMKMLHPVRATGVAVVDEVRVSPGDQVAADQILITFQSRTDQTESQQEQS